MNYPTSLPAATTGQGNVPVSIFHYLALGNFRHGNENECEEYRSFYVFKYITEVRGAHDLSITAS